jgi:hypothetical protein
MRIRACCSTTSRVQRCGWAGQTRRSSTSPEGSKSGRIYGEKARNDEELEAIRGDPRFPT